MTRLEKYDIYDELCHLLTDYEVGENLGYDEVSAGDLYEMLVKIQSNWGELTGEDE